jgi:hypothetical protein
MGRQVSMPVGRRSICSLRSKPEENALPAPRTTTARTSSSRSIASIACAISVSMAAFMALVRSGRVNVMRATDPIFSRVISWNMTQLSQMGPQPSNGPECSSSRNRSCREYCDSVLTERALGRFPE